jgi:hypothetical protein
MKELEPLERVAERIDKISVFGGLDQVLNGPSDDPFGSLNLVGGLRRSMAKAGYSDLKEFQKVGLTVGS